MHAAGLPSWIQTSDLAVIGHVSRPLKLNGSQLS